MSEKSTPTSILPTPLRETALAYLGSVFYGVDLAGKYIVTPLRRAVGRIGREIERRGRDVLPRRRAGRRAR